jgi:prepilin-type N-terminal cleavage/methylation domain-containing protein
MRTYGNHRGFTLIELSIVLVIIGILIGLGANMVGPLTTFAKVRETRDMMDADLQSIVSWASSRNMLPNTGATETGFKQVAKSSQDAWKQDFIYLYDGNLSPAVSPTKDTICGRRSTVLKLALDATTTVENVAFAIFSKADNDSFQSTKADNSVPVSGAIADTVKTYTTGKNPDIVRWVTLDELRSKIGCQGAPLKILNNELPSGKVGDSYNAMLTADGGVLPYSWCIEAATATPLPTNLVFSTTTPALPLQTTASSCTSLGEANWGPSTTLSISGIPSAGTQNSYSFTVYVRDNNDATASNDNIAQKTFVLTVNPQ